ncbi:MAG: restriction endonuclease [Patescibacteria group bacterium]
MSVLVLKADGESEPFVPTKLLESLRRAGAEEDAAQSVLERVEKDLYPGITTQEIYRRAFSYLRSSRRSVAARYSLKRAVMEFGPSGFPFEAYIAELLRSEGYSATIDQIIQGACVEHEVDVLAKKKDETLYVEAKFHNAASFKTDLKVTLYVKSRLDDIAAARAAAKTKGIMRGLIVTNTKFTGHAVRYAECAGVDLLGWEEPRGATLYERIMAARLYPVTALTTLTVRQKASLLAQKVVLCKGLGEHSDALLSAGVPAGKIKDVLEEAAVLCGPEGALVQ